MRRSKSNLAPIEPYVPTEPHIGPGSAVDPDRVAIRHQLAASARQKAQEVAYGIEDQGPIFSDWQIKDLADLDRLYEEMEMALEEKDVAFRVRVQKV